MKTDYFKLSIFLVILGFISASCDKMSENDQVNRGEAMQKTALAGDCMTNHPYFLSHLQISKELNFNIAESKLSETQLANLLLAGDYESVFVAIEATQEERLRYDSIPIYAQMLAEAYDISVGSCAICDIPQEELVDQYISFIQWVKSNPQDFANFFPSCEILESEGGGTKCKWFQYAACLAACTMLPPILNAFCAVGCYCEFCVRPPNHPLGTPCGDNIAT